MLARPSCLREDFLGWVPRVLIQAPCTLPLACVLAGNQGTSGG